LSEQPNQWVVQSSKEMLKQENPRRIGDFLGVLRNYCNHNLVTRQTGELLKLAASSSPTVRSPARIISGRVPRLSRDQIDELSSLCQQGQSLPSLAARYGIHSGTVKDHLRRDGVPIRLGNQEKLSEEDKAEIARLYEAGLSIHKVALRFNVIDNPVHKGIEGRPGPDARSTRTPSLAIST
jgi:DNA-binding CsgD family transcriptional regulator